MGRAGFVDGSVYAQNLQCGSISKTLGGTGADTVAVTFKKAFKKIPVVNTFKTDSTAVTVYPSAITLVGFTLNAVSSSLTSAATFGYIAFDDTYN